ncbi:MAG: choice-of-anchor D domain-containing protein [Solirubrobacterales bacterium]|nr:choice-of-anchor D domain-containing protein [Solirubrobacterales bacterium]
MAALVLGCLMLAAPSLANATWTSPTTVSGIGSSVSQTQVAGASDGTSWVVWKRNVGGFDVIQGTKVQIDGTQGSILTFSPANMDSTDPVVSSRADGSAMVGWINDDGASNFVQTVSIATDGTVGPVTDRSDTLPVGNDAEDISIALGDDGTAGVTWRRDNGVNFYVQAVMVAADGTSGTIHDLTDGTISTGAPSVGAAPPVAEGGPYSYRIMWPQGTGADSNVANRDINSDDSVSDLVLVFANTDGPDCEDPFDVHVTYGADGSLNAFWVCYRKTLDFTTFEYFYNWSAQLLRLEKGVLVSTGATVTNASPTVYGVPYPISGLTATQTYGGQPAAAWIHDLDGGGQRLETYRVFVWQVDGKPVWGGRTGPFITEATNLESPAIAMNALGAGMSGAVDPGAIPGQSTVSFARFSGSGIDSQTPSGSFVYSDDPGFVVAEDGRSMAAFTAIDGSSIGTARVMTFTDPSLRVDPDSFNYGKSAIGEKRTTYITIGSNGQTPNNVTGITLSGANAGRYALSGASDCVKQMQPNTNCRFKVVFTPGSTATQTAQVSVTSEGGNEVTNLSGIGLNQTRNRITVSPGHRSARKGRVVRFKVKVSNRGGVTSNSTRICVNLRKRALKLAGNRCRSLGNLAVGATRTLNYRIRVTWRAHRGVKLPVTFVLRSNNTVVRQAMVRVWRKGR